MTSLVQFADVGDKRRARVSSRADKTAHFNSQFEFSVGEGEFSNRTWTLGTEIRRAAKGQVVIVCARFVELRDS